MRYLTDREIGTAIKEARMAKGLTQVEFANKLEVGQTAITKWEKGIVKNLKRSLVQKMAEILEIPPNVIVGIVDDEPTKEVITISEDEYTPEQFQQIKQFISFIKAQDKTNK